MNRTADAIILLATEYPSIKSVSDLVNALKAGRIPADVRYADIHFTDNLGRVTSWLIKDGPDKYKVELYPNSTVTISHTTFNSIDNPYYNRLAPIVHCDYKPDADYDDDECLNWYALCIGEDDYEHGIGSFIWENARRALLSPYTEYTHIVCIDPKSDFCRDIIDPEDIT